MLQTCRGSVKAPLKFSRSRSAQQWGLCQSCCWESMWLQWHCQGSLGSVRRDRHHPLRLWSGRVKFSPSMEVITEYGVRVKPSCGQSCDFEAVMLPLRLTPSLAGAVRNSERNQWRWRRNQFGFRILLMQNYFKMFLPVQLKQLTVFPNGWLCLL